MLADLIRQARDATRRGRVVHDSGQQELVAVPLKDWKAITAALQGGEWKPIETVPLDGTRIKLWNAERGEPVFGRWHDDGTRSFAPMTHWAHADAGPSVASQLDANAPLADIAPEDITVEAWPPEPASSLRVGLPRGVKVTHRRGMQAICDSERSQHMNRHKAMLAIRAMLASGLMERAE